MFLNEDVPNPAIAARRKAYNATCREAVAFGLQSRSMGWVQKRDWLMAALVRNGHGKPQSAKAATAILAALLSNTPVKPEHTHV